MLRKSLLALSFLFMCPVFGCAKTQYYNVETFAEHCTFGEVKKAQWGKDYSIKITPENGYMLFISDSEDEGISIYTKNTGGKIPMPSDTWYSDETDLLTIPGSYVTSDIKIVAIGAIYE